MLPGEERKWDTVAFEEAAQWAALHKLTSRHWLADGCYIDMNCLRNSFMDETCEFE
jgi:hypothetical protein